MKFRNLIIFTLTLLMLGFADYAEGQRRSPYNKRKRKSKQISKYRGGIRGIGRFKPYYFLGANANAANYFGDIAPFNKIGSTDISFTRPGFGIHGGYKFHHSMAFRGAFNWYRISADDFSVDPNSEADRPRYARNLSFRNDIKELQFGLEIYLLPNYGSVDRRLPFNAYLFVGGAVILHDPTGLVPDQDYQLGDGSAAPQAGEWVKLRPLETEGVSYGNLEIAIPVSVGATFAIPRTNFNAGIDFGIRYFFTDYLDDVSTNYKELGDFTDPLARIMSDKSTVPTSSSGEQRDLSILNIQQVNGFFREMNNGTGLEGSVRGNPGNNDFVFVTQIKLTYLISAGVKTAPKFR